MNKPLMRTEPTIILEPEPDVSSEQATPRVPVGMLVEYELMEGNPTHIPAAEDVLHLAFGNYDQFEEDFT